MLDSESMRKMRANASHSSRVVRGNVTFWGVVPPALCPPMVVAARLDLLRGRALAGHGMVISTAYAPERQRIRVKFLVDAQPSQVPISMRIATADMIAHVRSLLPRFVAMDRGHTYSSGQSWVTI